jgi:hypothetical protein
MSINKDKKPKLSDKGQAKFFVESAESTPADQVYREIVKNSLEACEKMKKINSNFKGEIRVWEDPTFPNKLTVVDNGIGMSKDKISDLIINLSETEEESNHGNKGVGIKISGFANNKEGLIYSSKRYNEDKGSRCRIYFNDNDLFAVEHSGEYNSCRIPLEINELPELIQESKKGTSLTLMGRSKKENTLKPPENYEEGSLLKKSRLGIHWLKAYYNTKFFKIPSYIKFLVEIKRKDRTNPERVFGHKHWLDHFAEKSGVLNHDSAKILWWLLSDKKGKRNSATDCVVNGQLGFMNNDEILDLEFDTAGGRKNPLRYWGLPFSCGDVAVIIEPKGFKQDQYRTTLRKNGATIKSFKPIWKEFFKENMPVAIRKNEANMDKKHSERMAKDDTFAKNINKWLTGVNFIQELGNEYAEKLPLLGKMVTTKGNLEGSFNGGEGSVEPGKQPKSIFGKSPLYAGLKNKNEKHKSMQGRANCMPDVLLDTSKSTDDDWAWYDYDGNKAYLNTKCRIIDYYAREAQKQTRNQHTIETHINHTKFILKRVLATHIAMTRFSSNNLSKEEKKETLENSRCLSVALLNPYLIIPEIVKMSQNIKSQLIELEKKKIEESHLNGNIDEQCLKSDTF